MPPTQFARTVTLLTHIHKVSGSNLSQDLLYLTEGIQGFTQSYSDACVMLQLGHSYFLSHPFQSIH